MSRGRARDTAGGRSTDRSTRVVVVLVIASILAYWGLLTLSREYVDPHEPGSSYDDSAFGLKVWFRYLEELGYEPQTLERFDVLPAGGTLIAAEPLMNPPDAGDMSRVAAWVRDGGRLVLIGPTTQMLAMELMVDGGSTQGASRQLVPVLPSVYTQGIEQIDLDGARLHVADTSWVAHYKDLSGQGLLSQAVGEGEVVWLAGTYPVRNDGIDSQDNARLAVLLAAGGGEGGIYFDEYHHGYIRGGGIWERLGHGGRAALVLGVIALALLALGPARRLGSPIREPATPAARTGAYTSSLAELYRRAGARREALETLEDGLKRVLAKRRGSLAVGLDKHPEAVEALEQSARARARPDVDQKTFMDAAERLGRTRREVEGRDGS